MSHSPSTSKQINAAAEVIYEAVDPNANIIFGSLVDPSMNGEVAITVIATGKWCSSCCVEVVVVLWGKRAGRGVEWSGREVK